MACDVAVEAAEARAAEAEGLAQRCLLERDELLERVEAEAEAEARRGREETIEAVGPTPLPGTKAGRPVSRQRPASRASVGSTGSRR